MRVLIIDENYPSENNLYGDVFAHVRAKAYLPFLEEVLVVASRTSTKKKVDFVYEGVSVKGFSSMAELETIISIFVPDKILIHFATFPIILNVIFKYNVPYIVWVHGFEALGWYRRIFNFDGIIHFARYIKGNLIQLYYFRKLINYSNKNKRNIHFIFVSEWMKKIAETDCWINIKKFSIIPNPVNDELFFPEVKNSYTQKKFLMIRPFYGKKYATDIVTEAMLILQKREIFKHISFTIYGKGAKKSKLSKHFNSLSNVQIYEGFLNQQDIKKLHSKNGVFLVLSRQDAQGVSMCEAMASSLVPITSNNTAIPEFVKHNSSGLLTSNKPEEVANAMERIASDLELFTSLSMNASKTIIEKTGIKKVITEELNLIIN